MNINDGQKHSIFYTDGKLFIDEVQIGNKVVEGEKIVLVFETTPVFEPTNLEINVHDSLKLKSRGPGQL